MKESATIKMAQMARELKSKGNDIISLSLGEPDFDTPTHIKEAAKKALDQGITKYTPVPGAVNLREAICKKFKTDNQLDYSPANIVVSNGAKQCIANVCLSLLDDGDEVVILAPYWVSYFEIVRLAGGVPKIIGADIEDDFKISASALRKAITSKTKLIIFSSPCNPTGSVYNREDFERLAEVIKSFEGLFVMADEIYEYITFEGKHTSIGSLPGMLDRTITINGFSKGFSMTGWRLGYMGAPEWIASACSKIQGQFTSGANAFGQEAAAFALGANRTPTNEMKSQFDKRRALVKGYLESIPGLKVNDPKGAFYFFPDVSYYFGKSNGKEIIDNANDFAENILTKAHVAIVSGSAFGNDNCIRISYASSEENLIEAMTRIKNYLSDFV